MIPHTHSALLVAAILGSSGFLRSAPPPSKTQRQLQRLDRAEAAHAAKLASPEYHAALAKRERKRAKLLAAS